MMADLRWHLRHGGRSLAAVTAFAAEWAVLMAPIAPHLGEELHHALGSAGFASEARAHAPPAPEGDAEATESFLAALLEDTQRIRQVAEAFAQQGLAVQAAEKAAGRT